MADSLHDLAHAVRHGTSGVVALTGAGVSVASGVPSFRGSSGLWERYDPIEHASLQALRRNPQRVWQFLRELDRFLSAAAPNAAHRALAELGDRGFVTHVITQNVDGLHQAAGSRDVIELHGSNRSLTCLDCGASYRRADLAGTPVDEVPRCRSCGGVLKPDVTFFGEELPRGAYQRAEHAARSCSVLLVVGTSAAVEPSARLPRVTAGAGGQVWEINPEPELAEADGAVVANAEDALPQLVDQLAPQPTLGRILGALRGLNARRWFE